MGSSNDRFYLIEIQLEHAQYHVEIDLLDANIVKL